MIDAKLPVRPSSVRGSKRITFAFAINFKFLSVSRYDVQ